MSAQGLLTGRDILLSPAGWYSDRHLVAGLPPIVAQDLPPAERDLQPPLFEHARSLYGMDDRHVLRVVSAAYADESPPHVQKGHNSSARRHSVQVLPPVV